jgi:hypothetical protein
MRWLVYALGGGAGHLTRAYGLGRAALARGHQVEILAGGSFNPWLVERLPGVTVTHLDPARGNEACAAAVRARVRRGDFDRLIVDTFPRGLLGELPALSVPRVLVARPLVPGYADRAEVRAAIASYDLVLTPDWLVRDDAELLPAAEARRRLGVSDERPVALVLGTGTHAECQELATFSAPPSVHLCYFGPQRPYWPALELHAGIDLLVAAAGWNTVAEARACGTPLLARVRPRTYDDQAARVRPDEVWSHPDQLARRLATLAHRPTTPIAYRNGAADAVAKIDACRW